MSEWHGYEQHPDAHPERPWWRLVRVSSMLDELRWQRTDGARELYMVPAEVLAERDTANPLPPPEPRCGQVWVWGDDPYDRVEATVVAVVRGGRGTIARMGSEVDYRESEWPPPGAVLVAGPGAPWAPMRGE